MEIRSNRLDEIAHAKSTVSKTLLQWGFRLLCHALDCCKPHLCSGAPKRNMSDSMAAHSFMSELRRFHSWFRFETKDGSNSRRASHAPKQARTIERFTGLYRERVPQKVDTRNDAGKKVDRQLKPSWNVGTEEEWSNVHRESMSAMRNAARELAQSSHLHAKKKQAKLSDKREHKSLGRCGTNF